MHELLGKKVKVTKRWIKNAPEYPRYDIDDIKKWRMLKHPESLIKDEIEIFSMDFQHTQCWYSEWLLNAYNKIDISKKWLKGAKSLEDDKHITYTHYKLNDCNLTGVIVGKRILKIESEIWLDINYGYNGSEIECIAVEQTEKEYYMVATSMIHISKVPCDCIEFLD